MKKLFLLAVALSSTMFLAACGGGGDGEKVAAVDANITVTAANGKALFTALGNESFVFGNGVPAFGTAGTTTTVTINPPAAAGGNPGFTISSGGSTAGGTLSFAGGTCTFNVTSSTFGPPSPLLVGQSIVINDCSVRLDTAGQVADGVADDILAMLTLDGTTSTGSIVSVAIDGDGNITLNGVVVGRVALRPLSGAF